MQRFPNVAVGDRNGLGNPVHQIPPLDVHPTRFIEGIRRAGLDFDVLRGPLSHEEVKLPLQVLDDGLVHLVAGDADGLTVNDPGEGDHRDLSGPTTNVNDHIPYRLLHRKTRPDSGRHGLFNKIDLSGPRLLCRVANSALFHLGDSGGDTDHHPGPDERFPIVDPDDERPDHLLRRIKIGDHAILEGPDGDDGSRGPAHHFLRLLSHFQDLARPLLYRHHRRLGEDDPLPADVDERVGGPEVDGKVAGKHAVDPIQ